jgi:methyltransferase (TIGR00027 family)
MTKAAAKTAAGPTTLVAIEQHFPESQRITEDNLACQILPLNMRLFVWLMRFPQARDWIVRGTEKSVPGLWGGMMCRKRFIHERLVEAARKIEAVVNLGAGFDTTVYRLSTLAELRVWEVDQQEIIDAKRKRLHKVFGAVPAHVTLVPIDFDLQDLEEALSSYGYRPTWCTFFIMEAVTQYLTEDGIRSTFEFLADTPPGSRLVFTYVLKDYLDGIDLFGQEALYQQYILKDKTWLFGMDPEEVASFLENYGWRVVEHLGADELDRRYVAPTGRQLATTAIERGVFAKKIL